MSLVAPSGAPAAHGDQRRGDQQQQRGDHQQAAQRAGVGVEAVVEQLVPEREPADRPAPVRRAGSRKRTPADTTLPAKPAAADRERRSRPMLSGASVVASEPRRANCEQGASGISRIPKTTYTACQGRGPARDAAADAAPVRRGARSATRKVEEDCAVAPGVLEATCAGTAARARRGPSTSPPEQPGAGHAVARPAAARIGGQASRCDRTCTAVVCARRACRRAAPARARAAAPRRPAPGAPVSGSAPEAVFGKAITSRIESACSRRWTIRSSP